MISAIRSQALLREVEWGFPLSGNSLGILKQERRRVTLISTLTRSDGHPIRLGAQSLQR
jgi:hypothetical protein